CPTDRRTTTTQRSAPRRAPAAPANRATRVTQRWAMKGPPPATRPTRTPSVARTAARSC
ncbi:MAG: hypothetical protein AVDCRST_MAG10-2299, partial [uncultured Acidimicrobiales bacterium]